MKPPISVSGVDARVLGVEEWRDKSDGLPEADVESEPPELVRMSCGICILTGVSSEPSVLALSRALVRVSCSFLAASLGSGALCAN